MKGPRGHLWVKLRVRDHAHFTRQGPDIHFTATIPVSTAMLGGTVTVPTLKGSEEIRVCRKLHHNRSAFGEFLTGMDRLVPQVEPGTQPDDKKVLTGKGIKRLNSPGHGNEYIHFKVQVPK